MDAQLSMYNSSNYLERMKISSKLIIISIISILIIILVYKYTTRKSISPEEARRRIDAGLYDIILDVRTAEEWKEGHHPKATHFPLDRFVVDINKVIPKKDARVLIICRKGIRSRAAAMMAEDLGYTNVEWVYGMHTGLR